MTWRITRGNMYDYDRNESKSLRMKAAMLRHHALQEVASSNRYILAQGHTQLMMRENARWVQVLG